MSVNYRANYGIGYKVFPSDEICGLIDDDFDGCFGEYLYELDVDKYRWFEVGAANYTGEENEHFVCIRDPLKYSLDLTKVKSELDEDLKRLKIDIGSEFKEIGGLLIC